ncbi:MAG: glycoside hydrolase family 31 protein [Proteobacteria bacterium]|nr:glycoside hydrolase family 31 protein [Pseudomonadota bacterium]
MTNTARSFDPSRWTAARVQAPIETSGTSLGFGTNLGPLDVAAHAPGVLRLRIGAAGGADYGLLAREESSGVDFGRGGGRPPPQPSPGSIRLETEAGSWRMTAGDLRLTLEADPLRFTLARGDAFLVESITDRHFRGQTRLPALARSDAGWLLSLALRTGEPIYGLGEKFGPLDRRGQLLVSRNEDALGVNTEHSYKNIPFAWSPSGWGVFVNTPAKVTHGIGHGPWSHRSYALLVEEPLLDLFLISGSSPAEILDRFTQLTGRPVVPPRWSLGIWASRAYYRTADEALEAARTLRQRRFPCEVLTLDGRAWQETNTRFLFEWDAARYPDPKAVIAGIKALGFRVCCWEYPCVSVHNPRFAELAEKGYFLKDETGAPYRYEWDPGPFGSVLTPLPPSGLIDFTNPEAYAFWRDAHRPLFEAGVDVMKSDFGEQIPDGVVAANGDRGPRLHNVYPLIYNRCVFEATERYGSGAPVVWGRSGWTGSQRYPVQWGGDPQSDWEGMAASLRGALGWGMSGVPCYATDIGGFYGPQPDAELYLRWVEVGVFASHFRFHGVGAREPWAFGEAAAAIARRWFEFRYRLIPYLEACLIEAADTGLPVMRAMPLAFPDDPASWRFELQFLCGPSLLVVPVVEPGGRVSAYLPAGTWHALWSGESIQGGRAVALEVPLDHIPVFGREGHLLPLGPVVQHTGELPQPSPITELWAFGRPQPRRGAGGLALEEDGRSVRIAGLAAGATVRSWAEANAVVSNGVATFAG